MGHRGAGRALGFWDEDHARRQPAASTTGQGRGAGVAPRGDQLSASAAQAGPGRARHAGAERDRRRARADAGPAAERARDRLHPRRRHRRHQVRPGDLARPPRRARADALRRAQQDRRARGSARDSAQVEAQIRSSSGRPRGRSASARSASFRCRRGRRSRRGSAATRWGCNESRLPLLEAALGAQLLPQRRPVLEQVVRRKAAQRGRDADAAGIGDGAPHNSPSRCSSCADCAARTAPRCRLMLQRVEAETARVRAVHDAAAGDAIGAPRMLKEMLVDLSSDRLRDGSR